MNLAALLFPNGIEDPASQRLLRHAMLIKQQLPEPSPGSEVTIAFGRDREAFAAAMLGTWLKGHGAAIVENSLRERIVTVLDRPCVAMLLHDTDSGRTLQVPPFLAKACTAKACETAKAIELSELPELTACPLLTVHVQTDDGQQHWCSWQADELAQAIDELGQQVATTPLPKAPARQTPGMVSSMFANLLLPLRQGIGLNEHAPVEARTATIRGVPPTNSPHQPLIAQLLSHAGITDATVVTTSDQRIVIALAGPAAEQLASSIEHAYAFAEIPRDPNGQPQIGEVFLAVGLGRSGSAITRDLNWIVTASDDDTATLRTTVPNNYLYFEGHFAGYPVLAGGVQLHELVMASMQQVCTTLPTLTKLDSIKFVARIGPGDTIEVLLKRDVDKSKIEFEIRKQNVRCTFGRLQFAAPVAPLTHAALPNRVRDAN